MKSIETPLESKLVGVFGVGWHHSQKLNEYVFIDIYNSIWRGRQRCRGTILSSGLIVDDHIFTTWNLTNETVKGFPKLPSNFTTINHNESIKGSDGLESLGKFSHIFCFVLFYFLYLCYYIHIYI